MYTTNNMLNFINITQARNNLSRLIDKVVNEKNLVVLIRESKPQAVIISYERYEQQENEWKEEFEKVILKLRREFKKSLKKKGIPYPKTEEEMYELANKLTNRH